MPNILLLSTDLERFSYLAERGGFNLITFLDQRGKPVPENWQVDFVDGGEKNHFGNLTNLKTLS